MAPSSSVSGLAMWGCETASLSWEGKGLYSIARWSTLVACNNIIITSQLFH